MKILVVGSGGREHAIVHAMAANAAVTEVLVAPGNAGTGVDARNVAVVATDIPALSALVESEGVDLTVVGPEQPLVDGIVDHFRDRGHRIVGPTSAAARLEGSKAFSKEFMLRNGIPTAAFRTFDAPQLSDAEAFINECGAPVVIKASGLAAGKGAVVCETLEHARKTVRRMLVDREFGDAGDSVVVEEFMDGQEASVFALCDGTDFVLLSTAQDHKRVGEGDTGLNTGGMGAYAPAVILDDADLEIVVDQIIRPTILGMAEEGYAYTGFLYVGLMLTSTGPRVVEYNCRLGDPEAQVVLPLLKTDLVDLLVACAESRLGEVRVETRRGAAACVVLCSGGYPGPYSKGVEIRGLSKASERGSVSIVHAGTTIDDGRVVTAGGRVLGVTAIGGSLEDALHRVYQAVPQIHFDGMFYRRDIGHRGLQHLRDK
ncbi:MAG: phosphoribosylamine--glycine ligase [Rhodothermales bacterium]|nr:phosphoribosylamine--glycine ligase [Rhodothermales bacterium]